MLQRVFFCLGCRVLRKFIALSGPIVEKFLIPSITLSQISGISFFSFREIVADSDPDPGPIRTFKAVFYVFETVVTAVAPTFPHPDRTERQIDVVADNDEVLKGKFQFPHPVPDGIATEIHVG